MRRCARLTGYTTGIRIECIQCTIQVCKPRGSRALIRKPPMAHPFKPVLNHPHDDNKKTTAAASARGARGARVRTCIKYLYPKMVS